jgi:hypothetical protein
MKKKKREKPDMVVWDEERGYYPGQLTYGSNLGAPAIVLEDIDGWKRAQAEKANQQFRTKYNEIMEQAKALVDEVNWNNLIYSAKYSFTPVIGDTYFLYKRKDSSYFLSIIEPSSWGEDFIAAFKLDSTQKWIKLD